MPAGRGRALVALAAAAALSACASSSQVAEDQQQPAPPPQVAAAAAPAVEVPAAAPASSPADGARTDAAQVEAVTAHKPAPARPGVTLSAAARAASQPAATPRQLLGLVRADVQDLFGEPFLLKREGASELWQYRAPNCVLDVFLYGAKDGSQRVTHAELRARRENARPPAGCYAQILNAQRPQQQQAARS